MENIYFTDTLRKAYFKFQLPLTVFCNSKVGFPMKKFIEFPSAKEQGNLHTTLKRLLAIPFDAPTAVHFTHFELVVGI